MLTARRNGLALPALAQDFNLRQAVARALGVVIGEQAGDRASDGLVAASGRFASDTRTDIFGAIERRHPSARPALLGQAHDEVDRLEARREPCGERVAGSANARGEAGRASRNSGQQRILGGDSRRRGTAARSARAQGARRRFARTGGIEQAVERNSVICTCCGDDRRRYG